jgi:hypothetical protein
MSVVFSTDVEDGDGFLITDYARCRFVLMLSWGLALWRSGRGSMRYPHSEPYEIERDALGLRDEARLWTQLL